jgi:hypothetical protein
MRLAATSASRSGVDADAIAGMTRSEIDEFLARAPEMTSSIRIT